MPCSRIDGRRLLADNDPNALYRNIYMKEYIDIFIVYERATCPLSLSKDLRVLVLEVFLFVFKVLKL